MTATRAARASGDGALLALLGAAGFASVASTRLCDAMVPALALAFGTSAQDAAAAISAYAIAYSVMQLVCGPVGDRFGKPQVIGLAAACCALTTACAALAPSLPVLVLARAAMGACTAAIVPLTVAWIADTVPLAQRQQTLARYSGYTVFGLVLGPLLGGLLTQLLSWRVAFGLLAPLFAAVAFVLLVRRPGGGNSSAAAREPTLPYLRQVQSLLRSRWARWVLAAACIEAGLGIGSLAFVPTVLNARFGLPPLHAGAVAALFGLGGFVFSRSAAPLLRRVPAPAMPAIGGLSLALAMALLALMPAWGWGAAACTLAGFGFFALHNTLQVQATQLSPAATGLAVSLFTCCIFIGQSVGVLIGAHTFTRFAPGWSFAAAGAGLLLLGLSLRRALRGRAVGATALLLRHPQP